MNIYALMVIYNKPLDDSATYQFLRKTKDINIIVCDNSTKDMDNEKTAHADNAEYIAMPDNGGLAKAYNAGIKKIFENGGEDGDYVCLFDDDSIPEDKFFDILKETIFRDAADIYLPVVEDDAGIMSPCILNKLYCKRIKNQAQLLKVPRTRLTGINSGMTVRLGLYRNFSYNERYFMDYIDHDFILKMRRRKIYPKLMDAHIRQNFSAFTDSAKGAVQRFARQRKDLKIFYGTERFGKAAYCYVVCKKRLKLALKYKSFKMLFQ